VAGERLAAAGRAEGPITKAFMNWALAQVLPTGASVVSEYWARPELVPRPGPLSYFGTPAGRRPRVGACPRPSALKLARPERTVISAVGDGAYLFANPAACHHAMAMHDLPVLTVVCANRKWTAVQGSALGMYPAGSAARRRAAVPAGRARPGGGVRAVRDRLGRVRRGRRRPRGTWCRP